MYAIRSYYVGANGAHQPPTSCATNDEPRAATASPHHHWPDATTGKSTLSKDTPQAPGYPERGAVDAGDRGHVVEALHTPLDLEAVDAGSHQVRDLSYNFV